MEGQTKSRKRKKKRLKRWVRVTLIGLMMLTLAALVVSAISPAGPAEKQEKQEEQEKQAIESPPAEPEKSEITISAAGDFTLGTDESFTYAGSFPDEAEKKGLAHFTGGLDNIFKEDDLSTVNLETTLTEATEKAVKKFRFKGDPAYTQILTNAGIEAVNLANNHTLDYLDQGYKDTKSNLEKANIGYFGYEESLVKEVNGIKVGALGYEGWEDTEEIRAQIKEGIEKLRAKGVAVIIVHFHWGIERTYVPEQSQQTLARFTVDAGADLVLGHHPHVLQGIEEYNGKFIVYSLGNFMFGGNRNPADKDTFVFQQTFHLEDGQLTNKKDIQVVPFSISSLTERNDYRPTRLDGKEKARVMQKIIDGSNQIKGSDWIQYMKEKPSP